MDVIYGVADEAGESVDFADHMGHAQAQRYVEKLAANPAFEVEGSPGPRPAGAGLHGSHDDPSLRRLGSPESKAPGGASGPGAS